MQGQDEGRPVSRKSNLKRSDDGFHSIHTSICEIRLSRVKKHLLKEGIHGSNCDPGLAQPRTIIKYMHSFKVACLLFAGACW